MSCSAAGMSASWQPQYAGQPAAYPGAAYAQPYYATSPYAAPVYGGGYTADASSMQIGSLISQLSALMQALQGVVMSLGAGMTGNYGAPAAYTGAQQMGMPSSSGVVYPSLDGPVPYYSSTPNPPSASTAPTPGRAGNSSSCGCGCGSSSCGSHGSSRGSVPSPTRVREPIETPPIPTRDPESSPTPAPEPTPPPKSEPAPAPKPAPTPPPAPDPKPAPAPEQSGGIPPGADWRWIKERGETLFGLRNDDGDSQTTGGDHGANSEHYRGRAVDFGDAKNSREKLNAWMAWAKQQGLDVLDEGNHIHVSMPGQGI